MFKRPLALLAAIMAVVPASAQMTGASPDFKSLVQKHLQTSEEFTLKVADAMPAENYDFKLTPEQMSFGGQLSHLASGLGYFMGSLTGVKPSGAKPASASKADVMTFVKSSFDSTIAAVGKLTPEQLAKSYKGGGNSTETGYELLMGMLDHTTNHRASAEMYLRAKGVTPPKYEY